MEEDNISDISQSHNFYFREFKFVLLAGQCLFLYDDTAICIESDTHFRSQQAQLFCFRLKDVQQSHVFAAILILKRNKRTQTDYTSF